MTHDPQAMAAMFRIDVTPEAGPATKAREVSPDLGMEIVLTLRRMLQVQEKQSQLLEELINQVSLQQRQRAAELNAWKQANPDLAKSCRSAAEALSRVQTQFLQSLAEEVTFSEENLMDGEFVLNEFVDRYGPRLAHLNGVLQVLGQLAAPANSEK